MPPVEAISDTNMPSRRRGGGRLSQGLDREVYQVVRRILDEQNQYGGLPDRVNFAFVYDHIRASNSSLNRKPKQLLEGSIQRVLETIQEDAVDSEEMSVDQTGADDLQPIPRQSNGLNRSIVGAWAGSTPQRPASPRMNEAAEIVDGTKRRQVNGEPVQKKRKAESKIDCSPPTHVDLYDLGGIDPIVKQLKELLVLPMTCPEIFLSSNAKPARGILIHGPPGCGKTMLANAIAAAFQVNFISIAAPSIVSGMSGESEKALRDHFEEAKKCAPCLLFIDEIDAITPKRESAQREMEKRIVAQLLTCMDDIALDKTDGRPVIVLAATNRPDSLDPALRRAGRFDKEINMGVPSERAREEILKALTRKMKIAPEVDFAWLAERTPGFVGADLDDLISTASTGATTRYLEAAEYAAMQASSDRPDSPDARSELGSFFRLIDYLKQNRPDPNFSIITTKEDFLTALPKIQPSAMREGFATIPSTTFESIGSLQAHKQMLQSSIIIPILYPHINEDLGMSTSSGILLWGPPGCGKTLLAKAVANSSHANFISVKGPELLNKFVGESERAVRNVFSRARSSVPVIIFFDEFDALVPRRSGDGMSEASSRVVNTMLTELDGVGAGREGIYVVAATNRPDTIDPAMLRPGRLDAKLYVGMPDADGRVDILRTLCKRLKDLPFDDRMEEVARACDGFTGADLESLMKTAVKVAMDKVGGLLDLKRLGEEALRKDGPKLKDIKIHIQASDFEEAKDRMRPSVGKAELGRYERLKAAWGDS